MHILCKTGEGANFRCINHKYYSLLDYSLKIFPSPQINAPQINLHSCGRLVRLAGGVCYGPHSHSFANKAYKAVTPEPVLLLL